MEMTYFRTNETYAKGNDWFVNEMPCSYSNQITIMKDSQYFDYPYPVAERIQKFNNSIKLILIGTYSPYLTEMLAFATVLRFNSRTSPTTVVKRSQGFAKSSVANWSRTVCESFEHLQSF